LRGIANKARADKQHRFRDLYRCLDAPLLRACWNDLNKAAASGVDHITAEEYAVNLQANREALAQRLKTKRYRAKLVRRCYIPKANGKERPLGIPALEDKLVQLACAKLLTAIYEQDFPHSTQFSGGVCSRLSKASRREDLQVEEPVACWDCASVDFHPTLSGMPSAPLVGHQVVQMGQPAQKRLLSPCGVMKAFHGKQFPLDGIIGLIHECAGDRHLGVCEDRIPAGFFVLKPTPHPLAIRHPSRGGHVVGKVP